MARNAQFAIYCSSVLVSRKTLAAGVQRVAVRQRTTGTVRIVLSVCAVRKRNAIPILSWLVLARARRGVFCV